MCIVTTVWCFSVSLENMTSDIHELEKGMELTKREYEARRERDPPIILKDFLANSEDKLKKLRTDLKTAQEAYATAVEYYGENHRSLPPSTFFSLFVRFCKAYKVSASRVAQQMRCFFLFETGCLGSELYFKEKS